MVAAFRYITGFGFYKFFIAIQKIPKLASTNKFIILLAETYFKTPSNAAEKRKLRTPTRHLNKTFVYDRINDISIMTVP